MRRNLLKLSIVGIFCALLATYLLNSPSAGAFSSSPPVSHTSAPALGSFPAEPNCTECHIGTVNSGGGTLSLTGLPASYTPNQEINVTVTLSQNGRVRFGFQATVLDDQGNKAGELIITDSQNTQLAPGTGSFPNRQYIRHSTALSIQNQASWTFRWKAPSQTVGRVTFYVVGNAANGNFSTGGDSIYTTNASIQPLANFASVSSASFAAPGTLAKDAIAAGFGSGFATGTTNANSRPLPTSLDGVSVLVNSVAAGLFFVGPGQINYLIPSGTANGPATVTVQRNGADIAQGTLQINTIAPGLFAANANGQGVAAAVILRRRGTVDTFEPVTQFNSTTGRFDPRPIDLGPETDQVFLLLFGTAFRGVSAQSAASCTIGGTAVQVLFAGINPDFDGLDQANILLPRSLAGRGELNVVFTADNQPTNTVVINVL